MKRSALLVIFLLIACAATAIAQEQQPAKPTAEELEKQKEEQTKNAYRLLDQVIDESIWTQQLIEHEPEMVTRPPVAMQQDRAIRLQGVHRRLHARPHE